MTSKYGCNPGGEVFATNHALGMLEMLPFGGSGEGYGSKLPTFRLDPFNENIKL
jgi:hypothetical protein